MTEQSEEKNEEDRVAGTSWLEWAVALVGAVILAAMVVYLTYYGMTTTEGPPNITLRQGPTSQASGGYVVEFTARNDGSSTAATLHISGTLMDGNRVVEQSEAEIDYVPEGSERKGGLIFSHDPAEHELLLRSEGYSDP